MPERRKYERTPDTVSILTALSIAGLLVTVSGYVPPSILDFAPLWVGLLWSATFGAAAAVTLVGVLLRDPVLGWSTELVGRASLCVTALTYAAVLVASARTLGPAVVVGVVAAVGVSSAVRVWQIQRRLRTHLRRYRLVTRRLGLNHTIRGDR